MAVVDLSTVGLEGQQAFYTRMQTAANAKLLEANAAQQQLENENIERMNALNEEASRRLQNVFVGKSNASIDPEAVAEKMSSLAEPMEAIADVYLRGGAVQTGVDLLKNASEVRKRESDIENDRAKNEETRLGNILKGSDLVARTVGIAKNQSEWEYGIQQLRDQGIIEPEFLDQLSEMEFSPDVAAYLTEQAISAADKARIDLQRQTGERTEAYQAATLARLDRTTRLSEAVHKETARHHRALEKEAGNKASSASAPTAQDIKSASAALRTTVFRDVEDDESVDIEAAANYVASQAKALVKQNKAITWDTAVQQAILRGQQQGAFSVDPAENNWFSKDKPASAKFDGQGLSADTAVAMPNTKAQMKKGRYYITSKGVARWNGSSFELAE